MRKILLTGVAGFIGSNLLNKLLMNDYFIVGIDNFDSFYSEDIKRKNINNNLVNTNFKLIIGDISDEKFVNSLDKDFDVIIHLAAKAGVRPSIENPIGYQHTNVDGTLYLLEFARKFNIKKFIFASSSSVYGVNQNLPWKENENLLPISPYASTKLSCENIGHVYSSLYGIKFFALRFFTVYGPGQRPDLAIHKFFKQIIENEVINVFGNGKTYRDYTYVDDICEGIMSTINYNKTNYEIFNLGNNNKISLLELINKISNLTGKEVKILFLPEQQGDVPYTFADISKAQTYLNYTPKTNIDIGLSNFYNWFKQIYKIDEKA